MIEPIYTVALIVIMLALSVIFGKHEERKDGRYNQR
jgi:hypothetical protein